MFTLSADVRRYPLLRPFSIARGVRTHQHVLHVRLTKRGHAGKLHTGQGAASPLAYAGETAETLEAEIEAARDRIEASDSRDEIMRALPPGAMRAAVDAALWDWQAKATGETVFDRVRPLAMASRVPIAATIGLATPQAMFVAARSASGSFLKVKLGGDEADEAARIVAVRKARPQTRLVADVNGGWTFSQLQALSPILADQGYELVEQPLAIGHEALLDDFQSPLPLCLDESIATLGDLERHRHRCDVVNIKLEKAGGLTHALEIEARARSLGKRIFVGCMIGSAMAIAPALVLAQGADFADLDGPLWLSQDVMALDFDGESVGPWTQPAWGSSL
jgi:L-Ala-D/L-Glu epimerase